MLVTPSPTRRSVVGATAALLAFGAVPAQAQTRRLRVGVLRLASSAPVFIAQDKGYFREAGLDVELVFFDAAQPVAVAAASGDVDVGVTGLTAGLFNLAAKGALALIAGQSREIAGFPLEAYLATTQASGAQLRAPKDIRGHSLGVTQVGSSFHYAAGLIAERHGFPLSDIRFVPLQSMGGVVAALKGGRVDAAILPATSAQSAIDGDGARLLGWGGEEAAWQVGAAFLSRRSAPPRAAVEAFLAAYRRGCADYHDNLALAVVDRAAPSNAVTDPLIAIVAAHCRQPAERVRQGLAFVPRDGALDLADVARQIAWYQAQGFVDRGFGVEAVIDKTFAPAG